MKWLENKKNEWTNRFQNWIGLIRKTSIQNKHNNKHHNILIIDDLIDLSDFI